MSLVRIIHAQCRNSFAQLTKLYGYFASFASSPTNVHLGHDDNNYLFEFLDAGFAKLLIAAAKMLLFTAERWNQSWRTLPLSHRLRRQRPARTGEATLAEVLGLLTQPPHAIRAVHHRRDPHRTLPIAVSSCRSWHRKRPLVATAGLLLLEDHSFWEERRRQRQCHHRTHLGVPPLAVAGDGRDLRRQLSEIVVEVSYPRLPFTPGT